MSRKSAKTPPAPRALTLSEHAVARAVEAALAEDLGLLGDVTTRATVPEDATAAARLIARKSGVVSGLPAARAAFLALDPQVSFVASCADGDFVDENSALARVTGNARALLSAERVALNFLGRMSGVATLTRGYVDAVSSTKARIADTRKTTPGFRAFEKYAVLCGGGVNHRAGLFDAVLIKDNHIVAAGGLGPAITAARASAGHLMKIEVEIDTLDQIEEALKHGVDAVLLDNMTTDQLRQAVKLAGGHVITEASGGVDLKTVRAIAETGVDLISVGALTHSAPALDVGLDFETNGAGA